MEEKTKWLAFNINFPIELIPIYDFLQTEINSILSDELCREELLALNLNKHKGDTWREMRLILGERIKTWPIKNKAWYGRMLYENLRRELKSKKDKILIWEILSSNNKEINTKLFTELHANNLYPTKMLLRNMKRANSEPKLPTAVTFQLDYTISSSQMFLMDQYNFCKIQNIDGSWIPYQIILPMSLNHNLTGVVAKPRFIKRKSDGKYIGICSYQYKTKENSYENILGVDFGKIKYFSATALYKKGSYSDEFIQSKRTTKLLAKLSRLYVEKDSLYNKIENTNKYRNVTKTDKQKTRERIYLELKEKIQNLKKNIAKDVSNELVVLATRLKCKEIHVENLSWLESAGGTWNFSEIQTQLESKCTQWGIKLVKVSAWNSSKMHPATGEVGKISGRNVVFASGEKLDRDLIAGINLALRTKKTISKKLPKLKKKHNTARNVKTTSRKREIKEFIKKFKRSTEIVVAQPCKADIATWSPIFMEIPNSSLLNTCSIKEKYKM